MTDEACFGEIEPTGGGGDDHWVTSGAVAATEQRQ